METTLCSSKYTKLKIIKVKQDQTKIIMQNNKTVQEIAMAQLSEQELKVKKKIQEYKHKIIRGILLQHLRPCAFPFCITAIVSQERKDNTGESQQEAFTLRSEGLILPLDFSMFVSFLACRSFSGI